MKNAELIDRMAREATPVRPARGATLAVLWSLAAAGAVLALNAALFSARPDLTTALTTPRFVAAFASLLGILLAIAHRAAASALPGRGPARWTRWLLGISAAALVGTLVMPLFTDPAARDWAAGMDPAGRVCSIEFTILAVVPVLVLFWNLRHLAPTDPARSGRLMGIAAGAAAALGLCVDCNNGTPLHQVIWHVIPAVLLVLLCWAIGRRWLRW